MDSERMRRYLDKMEHINERLLDIETWFGESEKEDIEGVDRKTRLAIYKAMQEVAEASMDIVAMVLKDEGKLPKDDYTNIEGIFKSKVIDRQLREALKEANGLRNRLVHEYNELNDGMALESIDCLLAPMYDFVEEIKRWLRNTE